MKLVTLKFIVLLIFLFPHEKGFSQASFTLDFTRGCAPLKVKASNFTAVYTSKNYRFEDGGTATFDSIFTYNNVGIYSVTQICGGCSNGGGIGAGLDSLRRVNYVKVLPKPKPKISYKICKDRKVTLKIDSLIYDNYKVDWGDGSMLESFGTLTLTHTYPNENIRSIKIIGDYSSVPFYCGDSITLLAVKPINILERPDVISLKSDTRLVTFNANINLNYRIKFNNVILDTLTQKTGINKFTIPNYINFSNQNCFVLETYDQCGSSSPPFDICNIPLTVTYSNGINKLNWSYHLKDTILNYQVSSFNNILQTTTNNFYNDNQKNCCYTIKAIFKNNTISESNEVCLKGKIKNLNPITNLNATIGNDQKIKLYWTPYLLSKAKKYKIFKNSILIDSTTTQSYLVNNPISKNDCYTIQLIDSCDNSSLISNNICPIILTGTENYGDFNLNWNQYTGATNYVVEKVDKLGNLIQNMSQTNLLRLFFNDIDTNQYVYFRIRTAATNGDVIYSNIVEVRQASVLILPTAFTPNKDGLNEILEPKYRFIKDFSMKIYNRWGQIIFVTTDITQGWNGTFDNQDCQSGGYTVQIAYTDKQGLFQKKTSVVQLFRE